MVRLLAPSWAGGFREMDTLMLLKAQRRCRVGPAHLRDRLRHFGDCNDARNFIGQRPLRVGWMASAVELRYESDCSSSGVANSLPVT